MQGAIEWAYLSGDTELVTWIELRYGSWFGTSLANPLRGILKALVEHGWTGMVERMTLELTRSLVTRVVISYAPKMQNLHLASSLIESYLITLSPDHCRGCSGPGGSHGSRGVGEDDRERMREMILRCLEAIDFHSLRKRGRDVAHDGAPDEHPILRLRYVDALELIQMRILPVVGFEEMMKVLDMSKTDLIRYNFIPDGGMERLVAGIVCGDIGPLAERSWDRETMEVIEGPPDWWIPLKTSSDGDLDEGRVDLDVLLVVLLEKYWPGALEK